MEGSGTGAIRRNHRDQFNEVTDVETFFNGGVIAHAIATADEFGVLDHLATTGVIDLSKDLRSFEVDVLFWRRLLSVLEHAGIVKDKGNELQFQPGRNFNQVIQYKGFFTWLFSASGRILAAAGTLVQSSAPFQRNGALVGRSTAEFGRLHIDPILLSLAEWKQARRIVDLGCGDGSRLIELARRFSVGGVGVDISSEATELAGRHISDAQLGDQLCVVKSDVRLMGSLPGADQVDIVYSCLMGHDLWPRDECVEVLTRWRMCFPNCEKLIVCDTVRTNSFTESRIPTLGYEYLHAVMGQTIPTYAEWIEVLDSAGWPCSRSVEVEVPAQTIIFVCERRR